MSDIIVFTNRDICRENFLVRIEKLAKAQPRAIVLRQKELTDSEYMKLAKETISICNKYNITCILHNFISAAKKLNHNAIHLPLYILKSMSYEERTSFNILGASCHSVEEARIAEELNCTYITIGHIFDTDCKLGVPGRGVDLIKEICKCIDIPVYAIGGIDSENIKKIREAGAKGACVMSSAMLCDNPVEFIKTFEVNNEI